MKVVPLPGTPAMPQIELRPLDSLVAYHRNARTHSPAQVSQLEALLLEFGWTNAILVDDMGIVAGHGRSMAAANLYKRGVQIRFPNGAPIPLGQVPVIDCTGWSPSQRRAYILADNASALKAGWDEDLLRLELQELEADGFDLSLTAFEEDELDALLAPLPEEPEGAGDPDAAPPAPEVTVSVEGDVWVCGPHRVMCGSSLNIEDWDRLMQGELADVCITDPPYGVSYEGAAGKIKNDSLAGKEFHEFLLAAYRGLWSVMAPGASIYVFHSDREAHHFRNAFNEAGFKFSSMVIWKKNALVLGRTDHQSIHEPALFGWKPGAAHKWYGGRKVTSVMDLGDSNPFQKMEDGRWALTVGDKTMIVTGDVEIETLQTSFYSEPKPAKSELHPTTKPTALVSRILRNSAKSGQVVVDAFGGSGSTMIAAHQCGMKARLMELDPKFVDVICRRIWDFCGIRPVHALTGESFPAEGESRPELCDQKNLVAEDLF